MCDTAKERARVVKLLDFAVLRSRCRHSRDADEIAEFGLEILREHYLGVCPEECLSERARQYAKHFILYRGGTADDSRETNVERDAAE